MTPTKVHKHLALDALQRAVTKTLQRKRRLGQYYVVWRDGRAVAIGPDAPDAYRVDDDAQSPGFVAEPREGD